VAVVDLDVNLVVKVFDTGAAAEDVEISPTGSLVFISNELSNNLTAVNTHLAQPANTNIGVGNSPVGLAFSTGGKKLYVANRNDNNVSVIDVFTHSEIVKITIGEEPYGATSTISGRLVVVSNFTGNTISIIDTKRENVISTVPTGTGPSFLAILEG
jgi:YVTN family beta-propeller protein